MSVVAALTILDTVLQVMERQATLRASLKETKAKLTQMKAEGREPTEAEWADINKRIADAGVTLDQRAEEAKAVLGQ